MNRIGSIKIVPLVLSLCFLFILVPSCNAIGLNKDSEIPNIPNNNEIHEELMESNPAWEYHHFQNNTLHGIWGYSSDNIFAVGANGTILNYNGSAWESMNSNTTEWLYDIWGSSPDNIFAVGDAGTILHYDGTSWSKMESGTYKQLTSIWGSSPDDIFVTLFSRGSILHYDGESWDIMEIPSN